MQNNNIEKKRQQLAESVGEFIKLWGFKEIHGRVWVYIYLSKKPIAAKELTEKLRVTKGLISITLSELVEYQVIEKVFTGNAKSPGYQSNTDLVQVIYNVLRNRELKMTTNIHDNIYSLVNELNGKDPYMIEKLKKLSEMTNFAIESINKLLDNRIISTNRFKTIMQLIS